ncbi:MAG TPA: ATP-binding cassette domain-containing protein [Kineosporiaceae bacterium]|nr:ATP-binding cassette domain-containing protein [Kineosporiaceae bacterium]
MLQRDPTPAGPVIEARDLVKTYPGGITALDGVSLDVAGGTVFGLLGPNGAGKSTTVKILSTLAQPTAGTAVVAGHDVVRHPDLVRHAIGVVGQRSSADPAATGRENLHLQARLYSLGGRETRARASELLERFRLAEAADRIVGTWSGGMRRKLDVALGLVNRPRVLFLDEPTTGLDPDARARLWEAIGRLAEEGVTVLLTTHYLEEADRLAHRLAIVDRGRVVATGSPDALKSELHGDAIHIELAAVERGPDAAAVLTRIEGLGDPVVDGPRVTARADRAASRVPAVLSALEGAGVAVAALTIARPSLDDVYLRHTGRAYRPDALEASR